MYQAIFLFVLCIIIVLAMVWGCDKKSGLISSHVTPKLFEEDFRRQNKPIVNPQHVVADGVYLGPNPDGYKYLGSDPLLQEISPRSHRYDVDEEASEEYWDLFHRRNQDYTYGMMPEFSNIPDENKDSYLILTV